LQASDFWSEGRIVLKNIVFWSFLCTHCVYDLKKNKKRRVCYGNYQIDDNRKQYDLIEWWRTCFRILFKRKWKLCNIVLSTKNSHKQVKNNILAIGIIISIFVLWRQKMNYILRTHTCHSVKRREVIFPFAFRSWMKKINLVFSGIIFTVVVF
jgi:hypothetical protein